MGEPFRIEPAMPAHAYKTYGIRSPQRPATCEEVGCQHYLNGWVTIVAADSPQAHYIRTASGRSFREERQPGGMAEFTFGPGQVCFGAASHGLPWEGRERFIERGGDWRGNPRREGRVHANAADWVDSFANHQERLKTALDKG